MKSLFIGLFFVLAASANNCSYNVSIDITHGKYDEKEKSYEYDGIKFDKYYLDNGKVFGCICEVKTCIRKCCPDGQAKINNICQDHPKKFQLDLYNGDQLIINDSDYFTILKDKSCEGILLEPHDIPEDKFYIQQDGRLFLPGDGYYNIYDYCLSYFYKDVDELVAHICNLKHETPDELFEIKVFGMIISIPFLVATLVIYSLLPEKKNINTQCQMCYVFSLLCAYCLLISIQLKAHKEGALCTTLGLLCHYSFMTSFCWMNISCVDIFRTFSWQRGFGHSSRSTQMRRFFLYCLYTYGVPLIMIAIILGLNADKHEGAWFHPNFGMGQCWIRRGYPLMLYFYGPMGILLVANIILFILTALKIRQINKDTAMLRTDENKKHYESNKQRFNIYIKLIVVMGINWTLEFLSWLVDWFMAEKKIPELWYVTDMCNALYGVFIFYLFVCKRKIWIMIKKRYYIFMGKPQKARALSTNTNHFQFSQTNTEYLSSTSKI